MRKKLVSVFSAAALSASVMLAVPSSAWAGPSKSEPRVSEEEGGGMSPEVWENQDKLFSYGDWLAEQNEATDLGFIATVNDANSLSVKLLWEEDRALRRRALVPLLLDSQILHLADQCSRWL